jgi:hypothetical protein
MFMKTHVYPPEHVVEKPLDYDPKDDLRGDLSELLSAHEQ